VNTNVLCLYAIIIIINSIIQDNNYIKTVLNPFNQLGVNFPTVNQLITKRENKLLDYDECKSKVDKLVEKPSNDPTVLNRVIL